MRYSCLFITGLKSSAHPFYEHLLPFFWWQHHLFSEFSQVLRPWIESPLPLPNCMPLNLYLKKQIHTSAGHDLISQNLETSLLGENDWFQLLKINKPRKQEISSLWGLPTWISSEWCYLWCWFWKMINDV